MPSKKSYNRFFIILQEDQKGYGMDINKTPSGYAKLEIMNDRAKASFYVQNLKKQKGPYQMILIVQGKNANELINLGQINIDEMGKADINNEYNSNNVANTNISMDKVQGAAICRMVSGKVSPVMVGFSGGEELPNWQNYAIATVEDSNDKIKNMKLNEKLSQSNSRNEKSIRRENKSFNETKEINEKRSDLKGEHNNQEKNSIEREKEELRREREQLNKEKLELQESMKKLEEGMAALKIDQESLNSERDVFEKDKKKFNLEQENLKMEQDNLEKDKANLKTEQSNLDNDRVTLKKQMEQLSLDREALEKEKAEVCKLKKMLLQSQENSKCKCVKFGREDEIEEVEDDNMEDIDISAFNSEDMGLNINQSFDEYEEEIEKYKDYRKKNCKEKEHHKDSNKKKKCKIYPKENKEEFFENVVKDLEKVGEKENIKNCSWYKANVSKLESMYCVYDYNKYSIIYYPMICYYPYIGRHQNFMIGYKYDDDKLKYIIYAIPGSKELRDQPYEGKTGFVTFMPDDNDSENGYWLMYYDIDKNSVVVPIKRG